MISFLFLISSLFLGTNAGQFMSEHRPAGCPFVAQDGLNFYECEDRGVNYYVSVPDGCSDGGCGLIMEIHGQGMTGASMNSLTGMRAKGNTQGYIVVHAESRVMDWRLTDTSWEGHTHILLEDMMTLVELLKADEDKIHVTGFSQGCYLTWSLLCAATDEIASVACLGASGHDVWAVEDGVEQCYKNTMGGKPKRAVMYHTGKFDDISTIQEARNMKRKVKAWLESFEMDFNAYKMLNTLEWYPGGPACEGHCVPVTEVMTSQEESGLNDYDWLNYQYIVCHEENGGSFYDWGQTAVDFFVANPKPVTDSYSETVCDAPTNYNASLFVLTQWHVDIVIYAFALFGIFSSMTFLWGNASHKNQFTPVEQNNEL